MYNEILDTFLVVVRAGSFSKAATALYLSPVSVMKQMNQFESQLGFKVFRRTSQGVRLTTAGKALYHSAQQIITASATAIKQAKKIAAHDQVTITIATSILRPCAPITRILSGLDNENLPYQVKILPFEDNPAMLHEITQRLGQDIDLMVGPTNANYLMNNHFSYFNLGDQACTIAVPRTNLLAKKKSLTWADLDGQTFMLIRRGLSPKIDELRTEIEQQHPAIKIVDANHFYDMSVFNECAANNYLMESLKLWRGVHPSLVNLPMAWDYSISYGILYASRASNEVKEFISLVGERYLAQHTQH